ncbi:MAG: hypothetical protein ACSHX7_11295 [Luteolibacter sp.]
MIAPNWDAQSLANAIANYLQNPEITQLGIYQFITGILHVRPLRHISEKAIHVPVSVLVSPFWIEFIPKFRVTDNPEWIRCGADWHIFNDRRICLEWHERWKDHLEELNLKTRAYIPDLAAQWITNSAAHILEVHYTCHVTNRNSWPKSIPTWPHAPKAASAEYIAEKKRTSRKP